MPSEKESKIDNCKFKVHTRFFFSPKKFFFFFSFFFLLIHFFSLPQAYGAHSDKYPVPYLTAAAALGMVKVRRTNERETIFF